MAPSFLKNLIPKKDDSGIDKQDFMAGVRALTFMQVLLFVSGYVENLLYLIDAYDY